MNIKKYRDKLGLTQKDLSNQLYVKQSTISQWENGYTTPTIKNLVALSKIFCCTIEELIGDQVQLNNIKSRQTTGDCKSARLSSR